MSRIRHALACSAYRDNRFPYSRRRSATMKHIACHDLGFDCNHEIHAETEQELLKQVAEHAVNVHRLQVTPTIVEQVKSVIKDLGDQTYAPIPPSVNH